jgi:hypothetical protein
MELSSKLNLALVYKKMELTMEPRTSSCAEVEKNDESKLQRRMYVNRKPLLHV